MFKENGGLLLSENVEKMRTGALKALIDRELVAEVVIGKHTCLAAPTYLPRLQDPPIRAPIPEFRIFLGLEGDQALAIIMQALLLEWKKDAPTKASKPDSYTVVNFSFQNTDIRLDHIEGRQSLLSFPGAKDEHTVKFILRIIGEKFPRAFVHCPCDQDVHINTFRGNTCECLMSGK